MAARMEEPESRWKPVLPEAAKEVVFWCAVLVAVVTGAVLIGRMDAVFRFPDPAAPSSTVATIPATETAPKLAGGSSPDTLLSNAGESFR